MKQYEVQIRTGENSFESFCIEAIDLITAQRDAMIESAERGYDIEDVIDVTEVTIEIKTEYIYVGLPGFPMIQFEMPEEKVIEYYKFCGYSVIDWNEGWKKIIPSKEKEDEGIMYMWYTDHAWDEEIEEDEYTPGNIPAPREKGRKRTI